MSRRVVATDFGGPEVLKVLDDDLPSPGTGEVAVSVRAAGVNPSDHKRYTGEFGIDRSQLPMTLGREAAGVVTAVGPAAEGPLGPVNVGDEVIVYGFNGAYAEALVTRANHALPKPAALGWEEAAGLLLAGTTAAHLVAATAVGDTDSVLVHGASGGVGTAAVQLVRSKGARVIGTASPANHDFLRGLGVDSVTYGDGLEARVRELAPTGVDVAFDLAGTEEAVDTSLSLVQDRSRIATITSFERAAADGFQSLGGGPGADPGTQVRSEARFELLRLAESGDLRVYVDSTYPLDQVVAAHERSRAGHVRGKIILVP